MVDVTVSSLSSCLTLTGGLSNVFALFNYYYVCITLCVLVCVYNFPGTLLGLSQYSAVFTLHHLAESTGVNTDSKHLKT